VPVHDRPLGGALVPTPHQVVSLLAEEDRLRVLAAVVLGSATVEQIAAATGLDTERVAKALGRLRSGGLVEQADGSPGTFRARPEVLRESARGAVPERDAAGEKETDPVLRAFMKDGRLASIPASHSKRLVVLDRIAQEFEPGRRYPEREVNDSLAAFHPDYAALRRYLVDEGFLNRESGFYWRTGGTFLVD
jgi:hypothetical protein